jgi:transcriptional regulator with XRE-family HTH domain
MEKRTFAQRLQSVIDADDTLTAAGIATRAGMDNSAVRYLLSGKAQNPRLDSAMKICVAIGTTLEKFMSDDFPGLGAADQSQVQHTQDLLAKLTPDELVRLVSYAEGLRDARPTSKK